jgi:hypothetical protein
VALGFYAPSRAALAATAAALRVSAEAAPGAPMLTVGSRAPAERAEGGNRDEGGSDASLLARHVMVSAHMTRAEVGTAGSMYHRRPPSIIAFAIGDVAFWPHIGDAGFCIDIKKTRL